MVSAAGSGTRGSEWEEKPVHDSVIPKSYGNVHRAEFALWWAIKIAAPLKDVCVHAF